LIHKQKKQKSQTALKHNLTQFTARGKKLMKDYLYNTFTFSNKTCQVCNFDV